MNVDELAVSFMVTHNEVLSFLSQTVPCVGCRQRYILKILQKC